MGTMWERTPDTWELVVSTGRDPATVPTDGMQAVPVDPVEPVTSPGHGKSDDADGPVPSGGDATSVPVEPPD